MAYTSCDEEESNPSLGGSIVGCLEEGKADLIPDHQQ